MPVPLPGASGYLVTVADLGEFTDEDRADRALSRAWAAVVAECGWDPLRQPRTWTAPALPYGTVDLPGLNIGSTVVATADPVTGVVSYSYVAGFDDEYSLDVLRDVVVDEATRYLDNPRGIRSWSVGNESETYMGDPSQSPLATDVRLNRFRLPAIA